MTNAEAVAAERARREAAEAECARLRVKVAPLRATLQLAMEATEYIAGAANHAQAVASLAMREGLAECARLRVELEATERARQAAEEERDTALELVAPDAVEAARLRDDRDAARLAELATLRVALADARAALLENA